MLGRCFYRTPYPYQQLNSFGLAFQSDRFRHTARFARWRPDREPSSCTYAQLDVPVPMELQEIFGV